MYLNAVYSELPHSKASSKSVEKFKKEGIPLKFVGYASLLPVETSFTVTLVMALPDSKNRFISVSTKSLLIFKLQLSSS